MFAQQRLHWQFCLDVSCALLLTLGCSTRSDMTARSRSKPRHGRGYSPVYDASAIAAKLAIVEQFRRDGMRIFEIARRLGVSDTTIYNWRKQQHAEPSRGTVERELAALRLEIAHMRARLDSLNLPHQASLHGAES